MAITPEQRAAINRENSKKSTGPRTPQGKLRSSMNNYRHGMSGQSFVIFPEDDAAFRVFRREQILIYRPVGPEEERLVISMTRSQWLIDRANAGEIARNPRTSESLEWLGRHRYRQERNFFKLRAELKALQKDRLSHACEPRVLHSRVLQSPARHSGPNAVADAVGPAGFTLIPNPRSFNKPASNQNVKYEANSPRRESPVPPPTGPKCEDSKCHDFPTGRAPRRAA